VRPEKWWKVRDKLQNEVVHAYNPVGKPFEYWHKIGASGSASGYRAVFITIAVAVRSVLGRM
jgi:hypothetical protein